MLCCRGPTSASLEARTVEMLRRHGYYRKRWQSVVLFYQNFTRRFHEIFRNHTKNQCANEVFIIIIIIKNHIKPVVFLNKVNIASIRQI